MFVWNIFGRKSCLNKQGLCVKGQTSQEIINIPIQPCYAIKIQSSHGYMLLKSNPAMDIFYGILLQSSHESNPAMESTPAMNPIQFNIRYMHAMGDAIFSGRHPVLGCVVIKLYSKKLMGRLTQPLEFPPQQIRHSFILSMILNEFADLFPKF